MKEIEKLSNISKNALIIAICGGVAFFVFKTFDEASHGLIGKIGNIEWSSLHRSDKLWLLELVVIFVFLAVLPTYHFFEIVDKTRALFENEAEPKSYVWLHTYSFVLIVAASAALLLLSE